MTRVILLTFAVLGWAWFEMSGGTAFEPGDNGVTLLAEAKPFVPRAPAASSEAVATEAVTRNEPADLNAVIQPASFPAPVRAVLQPEPGKAEAFATPASLTIDSPEPQPLVISKADYRTVTASRVNLRGGPSTGYDVLTQLLRGEEVEILDDTGDGWVKLRALDGNDVGWMADSFLTAAN